MVKKIPERKCMGCAEKFPKKELLRIVRTPEGEISVDLTGKKNGRGVYICKNPECFKKVRKGDKLSRSLEEKVSEAIYDEISEMLNGGEC
ncbi:MAG: YlxR family protein [Clostridia bacterium]|nr:YlxR family protein [Clostridia bacterium]